MTIRDCINRLSKLESKSGANEVLLHFSDGSTRVLQVKDEMAVCCAAWTRISWAIGPPEMEGPPKENKLPFHRCEGAPRPTSPLDGIIDLVGRAERIEPDHAPFDLMLESCQEALEKESNGESRSGVQL